MTLLFDHKQPQTKEITSFYFKPAEPLAWIAGQSIKIEVMGGYGPIEHRFTISSAPYEKLVAITTRITEAPFKKALVKLKPGDPLDAHGLEGDFTWRDTTMPRVFVAAGIGITPFHSMLKQRVYKEQPIPVTLLYGSPTDDVLFKADLNTWHDTHPEFTPRYTIGQRLGANHIAAVCDPKNSLIYLSGPSAMVDDLSAALIAAGTPEPHLVRDWFTGRLPVDG